MIEIAALTPSTIGHASNRRAVPAMEDVVASRPVFVGDAKIPSFAWIAGDCGVGACSEFAYRTGELRPPAGQEEAPTPQEPRPPRNP